MLNNAFRKTWLLWPLFCASTLFAQQKSITFQTEASSLREVISRLETDYGFLFSYKEADIKDLNISIAVENVDIDHFLQIALAGKELEYEIIDNHYIVLKKAGGGGNKPEDPGPDNARPLFFCGTVIDSFTGKPLPFASVYLSRSKKGSYCAESGKFEFTGRPEPGDSLVFSYVGYEEKRFEPARFAKGVCPTVLLNHMDFGEEFVVVTDYLTDGIDLGDNGASTVIRPNRIGIFPGQVEPDILNTLQFLPGISSADGTAANINIRGGSADQNLILWEGIPIYHSAHYFGSISAFNPYIIDKMKVYRGGFGASFGGRVSGVIDLTSPGKNINEPEFGIGANFINAYTYGKFALFENKASFVYSARRSLTELWRSPFFENITLRNLQGILVGNIRVNDLPPGIDITDDFHFFDSHVKGTFQLTADDELSVAWFAGQNSFEDSIYHDRRKQIQMDNLTLKNQGGSFSWMHRWNKRFSSKLTGIYTNYDQDYEYSILVLEGPTPDKYGVKNNVIEEKQVHFSNRIHTQKNCSVRFGYHFTGFDVAHKVTQESNDLPLADETDSVRADVHVIYAEFKTPEDKKAGLDVGLRWSHYDKSGKSYFEPRARLWLKGGKDWNFHLDAGQYFQFIGQLIEFKGDNAGIETPIWVMTGGKGNPVLNAYQVQAGLLYNKGSWVLDVQAYHKRIKGLTSLATGFDLMPRNPDLGNAGAKGIDLLVKKRWKNYRSWISYSLSRTDYEFPTFFDKQFPAPYDQRHTFKWANLFVIKDLELSLGWKFSSGNPYSFMDRFFVETGPMGQPVYRPVYGAFYSRRLKARHQADASVLYHIRPERKHWRGVIGLSLFNIYQQENIYDREYYIATPLNQPAAIRYVDHTDLGFTPNMVLRLEW